MDIKEKVARQNIPEALSRAQKQYEQALLSIEQKNWKEAQQLLGGIHYPPELVEEAAKKLAVLEKVISAEEGRTKIAS